MSRVGSSDSDSRGHLWDAAYEALGVEGVSWYQPTAARSLELIDRLELPRDAAVIDVGGGASGLAGQLATHGYHDVTVLDISDSALALARSRLAAPDTVAWITADLLEWRPTRTYDLWHDRAVFHFLVDPEERRRYLQTLHAAVHPGGALIVATFAEDGPLQCSGLPVARYSAPELEAALGADVQVLDTFREEHRTPGGVVQSFTWLVGRLADDGGRTLDRPAR